MDKAPLNAITKTSNLAVTSETTRGVATSERFDYWRELFRASYIDRPRGAHVDDFRGQLLGATRGDGVRFTNIKADPILCSFGRRDSDLLLLGYVSAGHVEVRQGRSDHTISDHAMVLVDCDRQAITEASRYDLTYLELPRSLVRTIMGRNDPVPRGQFMRPLPNTGLVPLLRAHLDALTVRWRDLDTVDAASAVDVAAFMAVSLLARFNDRPLQSRDSIGDTLVASAHRHIQAHAHRPDLSADDIAASLGCSRTHLYRLFGQRGQTVGEVLREVRLTRARQLIETRSHEPLGLIAFACGYSDLSAFGKAFRRRFGMSSTECRKLAISRKAS